MKNNIMIYLLFISFCISCENQNHKERTLVDIYNIYEIIINKGDILNESCKYYPVTSNYFDCYKKGDTYKVLLDDFLINLNYLDYLSLNDTTFLRQQMKQNIKIQLDTTNLFKNFSFMSTEADLKNKYNFDCTKKISLPFFNNSKTKSIVTITTHRKEEKYHHITTIVSLKKEKNQWVIENY